MWQCLAYKRIGDDVSGSFIFNAPLVAGERFDGGIADFSDDMLFYTGNQSKFNANWTSSDSTKMLGNPVGNYIDWQQKQDGSSDTIRFDLWAHGIYPSDMNWTLRWKWTTTFQSFAQANNDVVCVMLSANVAGLEAPITGNVGYLGFFYGYNTQLGIQLIQANNTNLFFPRLFVTASTTLFSTYGGPPWTRYYEMKRTSATTMEATIYSDPAYTQIVEKMRGSWVGSITNLRFIHISNQQIAGDAIVNGIGTVDDIQFFNNTEGAVDQFVMHSSELDDPFVPFVPGTPTKSFDFTSSVGWTQVGTGTTVDTVDARIEGWGTEGGVNRRVFYDLFTSDGITMDDNNWTVDFDYMFTAFFLPAHFPVVFSKTTVDIVPLTPAFPRADCIAFTHADSSTGPGTSNLVLFQQNQIVQIGLTGGISMTSFLGVQLYVRLQRINHDIFKLSVFSDSARTIHVPGSPIQQNGALPELNGLKILQSSNGTNGGPTRSLTGTVDNLKIYNGVAESGTLVLEDDFSSYGTPVNPDFVDLIPDSTGWFTTTPTRIRADNNLQNIYSLVEALGVNNSIAKDLGPVGSTPVLQPVSFSDDFSTSAGWVITGTEIKIDFLDSKKVEFNWTSITGPNSESAYKPLGFSLSNSEWVVRFSIKPLTAGAGVVGARIFNLTDLTGGNPNTQVQDEIGLFIYNSTQFIGIAWKDNASAFTNTTPIIQLVLGTTYYVQFSRLSPTLVELKVFSDPAYTIQFGVTDIRTIPSTIGGLTNVLLTTTDYTFAGQIWSGELDDVQIWNGPRLLQNKNFLLRMQMNTLAKTLGNTVPKALYIGLFDKDQTFDELTSQSGLMAYLDVNSVVTGGVSLVHASNVAPAGVPLDVSLVRSFGLETLFIEIARDGPDSAHIALYQDEEYAQLIEKNSFINGGADPDLVLMNQLRYLKFMNHDASVGTGSWEVTFDDIRFWNARNSSCNVVLATPTVFFDDFTSYVTQPSADASWVSTDVTRVRVNITTDKLDFNFNLASTNLAIAHDLGANLVSDISWTLDATIRFSTITPDINTRMYIGLSSNNQATAINASADRIFAMIRTSTGFKDYDSMDTDGTGEIGADQTVPFVFVTGVDYFLRLVRDTNTTYHVEFFSDMARTITLGRADGVCPPTVNNLRYLVIQTVNAISNTILTGTVDDVTFTNNPPSWETFWKSSNISHAFVDPCQRNIQYNYDGDGTIEGIYHDLGLILGSQWVFRETVYFGSDGGTKPATDNIEVAHGLSSVATQSSNVATDGIFFNFMNSSVGVAPANRNIIAIICNGNLPISGSASAEVTFTRKWNPGETLYIEIIRLSDSLARFSLFSDPDYTFLIETRTLSMTGGSVSNLRFIQYSGRVLNRAGVITHSIDDVKVWNNTDVADPIRAKHFEAFSHYQPTGGVIRGLMNLNLDSSVSYAQRLSTNGGADSATASQSSLFGQNYNEIFFQRYSIINEIMSEKLVNWLEVSSPLGVVAPQRAEVVGKWTNIVTPISRFLIRNDQAGDFAPDSEFLVFGDD